MTKKHRISVCIATYNGEKYISEQIDSILSQLSEADEIIISDDHSTDNTLAIINGLQDKRIKFYTNVNTKGVIGNFANAISKANGDLVFLCDQDDIWRNDKVSVLLQQFNDQNVTLVLSNALLVNKDGKSLEKSIFNKPVSESSLLKHFVKSSFLGCAMAFRKNSVPKVFPIPENVPMHDWWIGMLHLYYGKVRYINQDLLYYRRHDNNVTSTKRSDFSKIIHWRINLFFHLVKRILIE